MAEIVQAPVETQNVGTVWSNTLDFMVSFWWVFVLLGIIIVLIILLVQLYKAKEENDRRRDSSVYATAHNINESCIENIRNDWVRKYWSPINLFWFGIPFKKKEHSLQVKDIKNSVLGWYRGHIYTQDGDLILRLYKTTSWFGFKENTFLLYCPMNVKIPKTDKEGNILTKNNKTVYTNRSLPSDMIEFDLNHNEIRIRCNTIQKMGEYYRFPNYVILTENSQEHIDLTRTIAEDIAQQNFVINIERGYTDFSRALGRAIEVNPLLRYGQKEPEKEKRVDDLNEE